MNDLTGEHVVDKRVEAHLKIGFPRVLRSGSFASLVVHQTYLTARRAVDSVDKSAQLQATRKFCLHELFPSVRLEVLREL